MEAREQLQRSAAQLLERMDNQTLMLAVRGLETQAAGVQRSIPEMVRATQQMAETNMAGRPASPGLTLETIEECFTYHTPHPGQVERMQIVREAAIGLGKAILRVVPDCPDRSHALRMLRDLRMWANGAISLDGRF